ncbi:hypothetical protein [Actinoplanes sp. NPDC026670]|uniref:hypothetical protein n=1 Tax=Actinoplanes sp. NPDC026670 TaxID=3154700 RepID=UPI0033C046C6
MRDEDMLRDVLSTIAGRAHDPGPVAAGITARARAHRQRRGLLVASAAAVTGVAGAVALWPRPHNPQAPAVAPSPAPSAEPPISYRPAWLPAGFVEVSRSSAGPATQTRTWQRGDDRILLFVTPRSEFDPAGFESVILGGRQAWAHQGPGKVFVEVGDGLVVSVSVPRTDSDGAVARKVAASIVPDPGAVAVVSLSFGWLPARFVRPVRAELSGTADRWREAIRVDGSPEALNMIEAELVWEWSTSKGTPATLRGLPGAVYLGDPNVGCPDLPGAEKTCPTFSAFATVDLGGGRILRIKIGLGYEVSRTELIRITNEIVLGPAPDTSWLPPS